MLLAEQKMSRVEILGCAISNLDMEHALEAVSDAAGSGSGGYVCFSNVHTVVTARKDKGLRDATNNSLFSMADGKPLSVVARIRGHREMGQVPGPDFMLKLLASTPGEGHYFLGSTMEVLGRLVEFVRITYPDACVAGSYSPPFRTLSDHEQSAIIATIRDSGARYVWVGLGAPKQELWMAEHWNSLCPAVLLGVGAAFDFHAGMLERAPNLMRRSGLEWLYRLWQEPRRLWRRYVVTNTLFLWYLLLDVCR